MHIRTIIYSTIIGILLSGCASVQKDWDIAKSNNNREAYIEFIEKYPNSRFADEAKDAISTQGRPVSERSLKKLRG